MKFTQLIPVALSLATTTLAQSFCSSASHSGQSVKETSNKVGSIGGIGYELWADSGNNSATFYSDGSFSCTFQSAGDYLCRSGLSFDSTKTPAQIGRMKADFKLVKQNISNVGYSYVGVYGWTRDPLVEYYIVDNWLSPSPPGDWVGNKKHGAFTIDGAQYTVYENTRTGPSIDGDTTFKQYFSIRQQARDCGTIDISAHFDQWEKLGMKMGKLHEAKVLGEAGNGSGGVSGTADFPYAKVYIGDGNAGGAGGAAPAPAPAQEQAPAPAQGNDQQQAPAPAQEQAPAQGNEGDWNNWGNQGGNQGGNPWDQGNQWNQGGNQGGNQWNQGGNQWNQWNQGNQGGNPWDQGNQWNQGSNQWGGNQGGNPWDQGNQWNQDLNYEKNQKRINIINVSNFNRCHNSEELKYNKSIYNLNECGSFRQFL
ncbi:concanavalin A-like lectin/glucanase [Neocallimastix lanati (nom. inval.)]|nr:concanavalin A-like lectin/glucanase [Neocallimastix sp. JGI-2020a]